MARGELRDISRCADIRVHSSSRLACTYQSFSNIDRFSALAFSSITPEYANFCSSRPFKCITSVTLRKVVLASSLDIFGTRAGFWLELELETDARCWARPSRRLRVNVTHILLRSISNNLLMV
jgi:hypothetical protein